jgi:UDP-4-amino-4,6-dideoxy-N-acetyl-beta-L-altrosamine N-acetyltransferase
MIKGKEIFLRPLKYDDWEKTITWRNDLEFSTLIASHPFPVTKELEKEWIEGVLKNKDNSSVYFGICKNESRELVGIVKLFNINWISRTCCFGIFLGSKENRGKGIGKEAMQLIINYAFNSLNLRKISLEVISSNKATIKLYEKMGFEKEGILNEQFFAEGKYFDFLILALLKIKYEK